MDETETHGTRKIFLRLRRKKGLLRKTYRTNQSESRRNKTKQDIGSGGIKGLGGFTLIEILVAISILSISLVVVLQLFSGALKSSRVSDDYTRGIFYAQEKMEEILISDELKNGVQEGDFAEGYKWRAEIAQTEQTEEEAKKLPFNTIRITLNVFWNENKMGKGKSIQLSTMKLVEKEADQAGTTANENSKD